MCVSSVPLFHFWVERFGPSQWIVLILWSAVVSSAGVASTPHDQQGGLNPTPPLPPPSHALVVVNPHHPVYGEV